MTEGIHTIGTGLTTCSSIVSSDGCSSVRCIYQYTRQPVITHLLDTSEQAGATYRQAGGPCESQICSVGRRPGQLQMLLAMKAHARHRRHMKDVSRTLLAYSMLIRGL